MRAAFILLGLFFVMLSFRTKMEMGKSHSHNLTKKSALPRSR